MKRRRIEPSPLDTLSGHKDYDLLLARRKKPRDVVSHRGWKDPTPRQLQFIAALARELGRPVPKVQTKQGASRAISALLRRRDETRDNARSQPRSE